MEEKTIEKNKISYQQLGRMALETWSAEIQKNIYTNDADLMHLIKFHFKNNFKDVNKALTLFGEEVIKKLEPLVQENNLSDNLPKLKAYDSLGNRVDDIVHHPSYIAAGNIIYQSKLLEKMSKPGGVSECLAFLFLSSQTGEAGHNCPVACSAGIIRVLQQLPDIPNKDFYLKKLLAPSFSENFTGAQFLTEIQGGSDVGLNAVYAKPNDKEQKVWRIYGDKWFCSNANADLLFVTARYNPDIPGTKGLALFLVPAKWQEKKNEYIIHRLKDKLGTRSMATGEIEFQGAYAWPVGSIKDGFHLAMDNVLHTSRLFNSVCVLAMARRAYIIAKAYAQNRIAFGQPILQYPLIKENLAEIKAENAAMLAGVFATARMQDEYDLSQKKSPNDKLLLRLFVNLQKYYTAQKSVQHIHHALDVLAGNGTIETFSSIPRLLRDCIICENWEGTHNVIRAQIHKDIAKYKIDEIYLDYLQTEMEQLKDASASEYVPDIESAFKHLRDDFAQFKQLSLDLQSLHIKEIVDHMASLYCAMMLLKEALNQLNVDSSNSKMQCYRYFHGKYVVKDKDLKRDQAYLKLINDTVMLA